MPNGICVGGPKNGEIVNYDCLKFRATTVTQDRRIHNYTYYYDSFVRKAEVNDPHEYGVWICETESREVVDECIKAAEERLQNGRR